MKGLIVRISMPIHALPAKVWEALTQPDLIRQYLFGTNTETDWKPGSPIFFRGVWEGKSYEDKGTVLEVAREKRLVYTYWSSFSGVPDEPENYKTITFELARDGAKTLLVLTQDNNSDEKSKAHSEKNWQMVLDGLKKLVESNKV
jgi:uncharacterized protein YndB with AHSA1/START domain